MTGSTTLTSNVWADVVGQAATVDVLQRATQAAARIVAGDHSEQATMTHAWLFTGPPGSGRSVAARAFAAALQCDDQGCGQCLACRTVLAGTHADVHAVVPDGLSIAVQDMREMVLTAARRPSGGKWQVVVIEDADRLTEAASNALLKAVEEPPDRTVFLLCAPSSHSDDISVTIRSRCRVVPLGTPSPTAVAELLVRRDGITVEQAQWVAHAAQGHVGRARRLATDRAARERRQAVLGIPASLTSLKSCLDAAEQLVSAAETEASELAADRNADEIAALKQALGAGGTGKGTAGTTRGTAGAIKDLERRQKSRSTRTQRDSLDRALVDLAGFYRDVLVAQSGADVPRAHPDANRAVQQLAAILSPEGALARLDSVLSCRTALELNVKPRIAVEAMTAALRLP